MSRFKIKRVSSSLHLGFFVNQDGGDGHLDFFKRPISACNTSRVAKFDVQNSFLRLIFTKNEYFSCL